MALAVDDRGLHDDVAAAADRRPVGKDRQESLWLAFRVTVSRLNAAT